jgi:hypothetical protein
MALINNSVVDEITVSINNFVYFRTNITIVDEYNNIVSQNYVRESIYPGQDYSEKDTKVKAICAIIHTAQVIADYEASLQTHNTTGA